VISRYLARFAVATLTTALMLSLAGRAGVSAQQPPPPAPQGAQPPQGPPGGQGGRGGFQLRNVQVLKDVPPDQFQLVMQYVAASLGVQCNYCHVMGDNASDDKETKKTARKMMQMVSDLNTQFLRRQREGELCFVPQRPSEAVEDVAGCGQHDAG
jgi:hypothetical protein